MLQEVKYWHRRAEQEFKVLLWVEKTEGDYLTPECFENKILLVENQDGEDITHSILGREIEWCILHNFYQ